MNESKPVYRDLQNDADWLRDVAEQADEIDSEWPNQMLWPETAENLKDIAVEVERFGRMRSRLQIMLDDLRELRETQTISPLFQNSLTGSPVPAMAINTLIEGLSITLEDGDYRDCETANKWSERNRA